jgi:hypothetical protein
MDAITTTLRPVNNLLRPLDNIYVTTIIPVIEEPHVSALIGLIISFNIVYLANKLPEGVKCIVEHPITQALVIFVTTYRMYGNFVHGLITTAVLMALIVMVKGGAKKMMEAFKIISPGPEIYPGCLDVKIKDLLLLFDGDEGKLRHAMYRFGVPLDTRLDDDNAPLISTYLINFGNNVSDTCLPPQ